MPILRFVLRAEESVTRHLEVPPFSDRQWHDSVGVRLLDCKRLVNVMFGVGVDPSVINAFRFYSAFRVIVRA